MFHLFLSSLSVYPLVRGSDHPVLMMPFRPFALGLPTWSPTRKYSTLEFDEFVSFMLLARASWSNFMPPKENSLVHPLSELPWRCCGWPLRPSIARRPFTDVVESVKLCFGKLCADVLLVFVNFVKLGRFQEYSWNLMLMALESWAWKNLNLSSKLALALKGMKLGAWRKHFEEQHTTQWAEGMVTAESKFYHTSSVSGPDIPAIPFSTSIFCRFTKWMLRKMSWNPWASLPSASLAGIQSSHILLNIYVDLKFEIRLNHRWCLGCGGFGRFRHLGLPRVCAAAADLPKLGLSQWRKPSFAVTLISWIGHDRSQLRKNWRILRDGDHEALQALPAICRTHVPHSRLAVMFATSIFGVCRTNTYWTCSDMHTWYYI